MGVPAQPFEQLMGVMPKQSAHCIPPCYRHLLSSPKSEIIDFYPIDFRLDINGARYAWMGVNLLPFIDRQRLIKAMRKADQDGAKLTPIEQDRNRTGTVMLFFARNEKSESALQQTLDKKLNGNLELFASFQRKDQISGTVKVLKNAHQIGQKISRPHVKLQMSEITDNQVYQINYEHPTYEQHLTKLLDGLKHEPKEVEEFEIYSLNRRFFNGENAVRMLERILGIDASVSAVYRPQGYQNNQGNYNQQRQVDQAFRGSGSSQYAYSGQGGYNQGYSGSSGHGYQSQQQDHMLGKRGQRDYSNDDRGYHQDKRYEASAQGSQGYGGYNQHQEQQQQQPPNINYNLGYNNNNRRDYNQQQSHSTSNQHQDYQQQNRQNQRGHQQSNSSYDNRQQYGSSNQNYQQHQQQYQQQYNQGSQQSSVLAQPQPYQQPQQQPPNQLINLLQQLQNVPQQRNQQNQGQNGGQQQNNGQERNGSNYNRFQGFGQ